ncbi:MAG: RpiB/LacA/LacB family sugar-phosphate isomerase [Actinobacteria bacterium]|nr:RpiB/LacA/LacB family sugar-phosphate isomerase [Actinomycetota bacterium]
MCKSKKEVLLKVAVVLETVTCERGEEIISALDGRGFEILNAGMKKKDDKPELTYINTGLLGAILLNLGVADFVIGGCGTGQGFFNSILQYPNVFCGHILTPLDAWLFARINAGNCISLALTQGYGWASEINLKYIFDKLFLEKFGLGYPESRFEIQAVSRKRLSSISEKTHHPFYEIIENIDHEVLNPVLKFPGVLEMLDIENKDFKIQKAFKKRLSELQ